MRYTLAAEPGPAPLPRADLYRELTRNIQYEILEVAFPRTRRLLGEGGMKRLMGEFLADGGPETLQYPCVPDDLIHWAFESRHPQADLLDYERTTARAERHPAEIDSLRAPGKADTIMLNPTLQVSTYSRPVHEITPDNPDPQPAATPFVYLAWRRPISDRVARQRVGVSVGRCLGLIGLEPLTRDQWIRSSLAKEAESDAARLRAVLLETHRALLDRSGLFAAV
ncbi:MAG: putative DNA-binding domain-containing protein [Myxococcota bacterium]